MHPLSCDYLYFQIVLLGDHKQLQPVIHVELLQRLGMGKSLFERYMKKAIMLDTQYRMVRDVYDIMSRFLNCCMQHVVY